MAQNPSPLLGLALQVPGTNINTWGTILNNQVFESSEQKMASIIRVPITGVTTPLTATNYTPNQVRRYAHVFTGALTANSEVIVPASDNPWYVRNETTGNFTLTIKTGGGTGVALSKDCWIKVAADGTTGNVVDLRPTKWGYQRLQEIQDADANSPHDAMNRQTTLAIPVNDFAGATGNLDMGGNKIINLAAGDPASTDAINAQQLDAAIAAALTPVTNPATVKASATDTTAGFLAVKFDTPAQVTGAGGDEKIIPILSGNSLYLWSTCI